MPTGRPDFTYLADTDIIAQTIGNLSVDIAAQTLSTLGINITAQDLAELIIKINAQTVGLYLQPEWAALEGEDKHVTTLPTQKARDAAINVDYTVTAGKKFYLIGFSFGSYSFAAADYDKHLNVRAYIFNTTTFANYAMSAALGGRVISFSQPIVFNALETCRLIVYNEANVDCFVFGSIWGYEI